MEIDTIKNAHARATLHGRAHPTRVSLASKTIQLLLSRHVILRSNGLLRLFLHVLGGGWDLIAGRQCWLGPILAIDL